MTPGLGAYVLILVVAAGATFVLTPLVRRVSIRVGAVVVPDERRVHERPTPTLCGIAMLGAFLLSMGVATQIAAFDPLFDSTSAPLAVVLGAVTILVVGVIDDLREVSAPAKLAGMVFAGSILYLLGVSLFFFRIPFAGIFILGPDLAPLVTVVWVVGMANAVNFIDGLDGLAAGVVAIAAGAFFLYGDRLANAGILDASNPSPLLAVIVLGVCIGFLPHNFHPARIFMGDGGALLLGLLMAASTMLVGGQTDDPFSGQTFFFFAPLFIPFFILGVPIIDTLFAIVRRASKRASPAAADKDHLHHRLMRLGHGQRRSVVILWLWTALLSAFALYPTYTGTGDAVVPFAVVAIGLLLYTYFHPGVRRARRTDGEGSVDSPDEAADRDPIRSGTHR
ncbi:MraY family glycosyltransferase [soil metagenome]